MIQFLSCYAVLLALPGIFASGSGFVKVVRRKGGHSDKKR